MRFGGNKRHLILQLTFLFCVVHKTSMGTQGLILSGAGGLPSTGYGGLGVLSQPLILFCQATNDLREKGMKRQESCFHLLQKENCMIFSGPALHLISNDFIN